MSGKIIDLGKHTRKEEKNTEEERDLNIIFTDIDNIRLAKAFRLLCKYLPPMNKLAPARQKEVQQALDLVKQFIETLENEISY